MIKIMSKSHIYELKVFVEDVDFATALALVDAERDCTRAHRNLHSTSKNLSLDIRT